MRYLFIRKDLIKKIRHGFICLIFFVPGCREHVSYNTFILTRDDTIKRQAFLKRAYSAIAGFEKMIQGGDVITRTGNDFTSESLRMLNRHDKTWSHCGIAAIENDSVFVYHALGGDFNPDQKILREPLKDFAEPKNNRCAGIFRFQLNNDLKKHLLITIKDFYNKEVMFDMDFDLLTDDRMYCSEFVYKSLEKCSWGLLKFNHSHIRQFEFIGVDDILLHPLCSLKQQIVYK